jgi:DNA-binding NarL/FixJ family response regulator
MDTGKKLNVLVAEETEVTRTGIATMLTQLDYIHKVYPARTATEAVQVAPFFKTDVAVVSNTLPDVPLPECISKIKEQVPHVAVIVKGEHLPTKNVHALMRYGCNGFLQNNFTAAELCKAITTTIKGQPYFAAAIANEIANHTLGKLKKANTPLTISLTGRERAVLFDIYDCLTTKLIADKHSKSIKAIEKIRHNLIVKAKAKNVVGLIKFALRTGIIVDMEI